MKASKLLWVAAQFAALLIVILLTFLGMSFLVSSLLPIVMIVILSVGLAFGSVAVVAILATHIIGNLIGEE